MQALDRHSDEGWLVRNRLIGYDDAELWKTQARGVGQVVDSQTVWSCSQTDEIQE